MAHRQLLVVSLHFAPTAASGTYRMVGLARHLPEFGWGTVVVAPPSLPWEPVDHGLDALRSPETTLIPAPFPRGLLTRPLRGLDPYAAWLLRACVAGLKALRERRPAAILTTGPPHVTHAVGMYLKRRSGLPWVADFRDPWITVSDPNAPTCGNLGAPGSVRRRSLGRLERSVLTLADVVTTTAPGTTAMLGEAYPAHRDKLVTLTNGFDPEAFASRDRPSDRSGPLALLHAGELYAGRDPSALFDAIAGLQGGPHAARLRLLGRSSVGDAALAAEIERRGLGGVVENLGQVSYERSLEEMSRSDVLIVVDSPGRRVGIPAKLFEYLGAGRPILALAESDGDLAWALDRSEVPHRIAPPNDPGAIGRAIVELAAEVAVDRERTTDRVGPECFTRRSIAGQLATILDNCVEGLQPVAEAPPTPERNGYVAPSLRLMGRVP